MKRVDGGQDVPLNSSNVVCVMNVLVGALTRRLQLQCNDTAAMFAMRSP